MADGVAPVGQLAALVLALLGVVARAPPCALLGDDCDEELARSAASAALQVVRRAP